MRKLNLNPEEILKFLETLLPFLITKKKQAQLLIEYCSKRIRNKPYSSREFEIQKEVQQLNAH